MKSNTAEKRSDLQSLESQVIRVLDGVNLCFGKAEFLRNGLSISEVRSPDVEGTGNTVSDSGPDNRVQAVGCGLAAVEVKLNNLFCELEELEKIIK